MPTRGRKRVATGAPTGSPARSRKLLRNDAEANDSDSAPEGETPLDRSRRLAQKRYRERARQAAERLRRNKKTGTGGGSAGGKGKGKAKAKRAGPVVAEPDSDDGDEDMGPAAKPAGRKAPRRRKRRKPVVVEEEDEEEEDGDVSMSADDSDPDGGRTRVPRWGGGGRTATTEEVQVQRVNKVTRSSRGKTSGTVTTSTFAAERTNGTDVKVTRMQEEQLAFEDADESDDGGHAGGGSGPRRRITSGGRSSKRSSSTAGGGRRRRRRQVDAVADEETRLLEDGNSSGRRRRRVPQLEDGSASSGDEEDEDEDEDDGVEEDNEKLVPADKPDATGSSFFSDLLLALFFAMYVLLSVVAYGLAAVAIWMLMSTYWPSGAATTNSWWRHGLKSLLGAETARPVLKTIEPVQLFAIAGGLFGFVFGLRHVARLRRV